MKTKVLVINPSTGEELQTVTVKSNHRPQAYETFYMADQSKELELVADKEITPTALRVYMGLKCVMDFNNYCNVTQTELSEKLKIDIAGISRGINLLAKKKIIEKVKHRGRYFTYRINPIYSKKGNQIKRVK
jgi:DNA-binding MarR family transcriptional regulator